MSSAPFIRYLGWSWAWRLALLGWLLVAGAGRTCAQQLLDYQYVDSLNQALLEQQRWRALDSVGRAAIAQGSDYPALRRRLGAGALATSHLAAALRYYGPALHQNPLDDEARAGLAATYLAFNQPGPAALLAGTLPAETSRALGLPRPRALTELEVEISTLQTSERRRGAGTYGRLSVGSRLSPRLSLTQDFSYYHQSVELPRYGFPGGIEEHRISQNQYHALLVGQLAPRWQAKAGYDFITRDLGSNHLGYLALAYARPVWTAQAGLYAGMVTDTARVQADLRLTVYPLGNLRLYGFGRGSLVRSVGRTYPNALLGAGGRLRPWLWAEAWGSAGAVPVLAEADGTYVYNLLDPLGRRAAASLLILGARRLRLRLVYGAEQRRITLINKSYSLSSFSAALAWIW
ncbi:hypothetical protein [Hymenobacter bucti]|uniref:Uncharacterized protein n=1 Tax=Hymenobacter bucti TaxID=1844114 RepID=A0ABW4QWN0_9BACT